MNHARATYLVQLNRERGTVDSITDCRLPIADCEFHQTVGGACIDTLATRNMMPSVFITTALLLTSCKGFQGPAFTIKSSVTHLLAKKKVVTTANSSGQGFGAAPSPVPRKDPDNGSSTISGNGLQSVESGRSNAIPTFPQSTAPPLDPNLPVGERTKKILADQYGLRTLEEQRREEKLQEQRLKFERLKQEAEKNEDFDILSVLPAPLILGIDRFLKIGLAVCVVLFVAGGVGITAEAWSVASGSPLPEDIDSFIVNVVEPNFTPGLLVLLGFSVSLGLFASAQLGSSASVYSEDR
jgi:hypothetical protein